VARGRRDPRRPEAQTQPDRSVAALARRRYLRLHLRPHSEDQLLRFSVASNLARVYKCTQLAGGCGRSWRAEPIDEFVTSLVRARLAQPDAANLPIGDDDEGGLGDLASEATGIRSRLAQMGVEFGDDDQADLAEFRTAARRLANASPTWRSGWPAPATTAPWSRW